MINLWTQEWGWSDWRAHHSHLNDKEAKTLYLMEQAMYQDMHTQHVINNINAPAGGGALTSAENTQNYIIRIDTSRAGILNINDSPTGLTGNSLQIMLAWPAYGPDYESAGGNPQDYIRNTQVEIKWGDGTTTLIPDLISKSIETESDSALAGNTTPNYWKSTIFHTYSSGGIYDIEVNIIGPNFIYPVVLDDTSTGPRYALDRERSMVQGYTIKNSNTSTFQPPFFSEIGFARQYDVDFLTDVSPSIDQWDMSKCINLAGAFFSCPHTDSLVGISNWDTSNVKYLANIFAYFFNGYSVELKPDGLSNLYDWVKNWDVSNCVDFSYCFLDNGFENGDFSTWNLKSAITIRGIFYAQFGLGSGMTKENLEATLVGWANNPETADNVNAQNFISKYYDGVSSISGYYDYPTGGPMDLAIQALTAKGWTISGITIA